MFNSGLLKSTIPSLNDKKQIYIG